MIELINTNYPNYEYYEIETFFNLLNNKNINDILDELLRDLDCTKLLKDGRQIQKTSDNRYKRTFYLFIRCMFRLDNPFVYNHYYDELLKVHKNNMEFEEVYKEPVKNNKSQTKTKKKKVENKFFRSVTHDMFTNEVKYIYWNPKTNEEIISTNGDLLEELNNNIKKKKPKTSNIVVPKGIVYKFNF